MSEFILPRDFHANRKKTYLSGGIGFEVWVQDMGFPEAYEGDNLWHFVLVVRNKMIEAGEFRHNQSDYSMSSEDVADNIATLYSSSENVRKAIEEFDTIPDIRQKWVDPMDLDEIILKCVHYMWSEVVPEPTFLDADVLQYDIVKAHMDKDGSWNVILSTPLVPGALVEFVHKTEGGNRAAVSTYVKTHSMFVDL